jgi:hypothetical protein
LCAVDLMMSERKSNLHSNPASGTGLLLCPDVLNWLLLCAA